MKLRSTQILSVNASGLARVSEIYQAVVNVPTETVYGLGADARSDEPLPKSMKQRPP